MDINLERKLVVVRTSDGVTFNFVITPATRITVGDQPARLADLAANDSKAATIKFVPMRHGNIAKSVVVTQ